MKYNFTCSGHRNILATHKTTLEFTKDSNITEKGDCIIGVNADFDKEKVKEFLKYGKIKISMKVGNLEEVIICKINPNFDDNNEIVIRLGVHDSKRTLGTDADKAAIHLNRKLVEKMKYSNSKLVITISE